MIKKYNTLGTIGIAVMSVFFLANSGGSPGGRTGSTADAGRTCATVGGCHAGGGPIISQEMISTNIPATGYTPGADYVITLNPEFTGAGRYGFEMMVEDGAANAAGSFKNGDDGNIQNGGDRITHKFASGSGGNVKTWELDWTAPVAGSGDLDIYAAVLAANGNGSTGGDRLLIDTLRISENSTASIQQTIEADVKLYPNPVVNELHIEGINVNHAQVNIIDIQGKVVINQKLTPIISVAELESGSYYLKIALDGLVLSKPFVKR